MSGDVIARRKKKNGAKKSTEDDVKMSPLMKEPENPRIRLVPRKAREAKIEVQEEKRFGIRIFELCFINHGFKCGWTRRFGRFRIRVNYLDPESLFNPLLHGRFYRL